jgi:hypothetical protein
MKTTVFRIVLNTVVMCLAAGHLAAQPPGKGSGKPGGASKPAPDIVYMSDDDTTAALSQAAIRGTVLAADGLGGSDVSLQKSKAGRNYFNIAISPDGRQMAWIQLGSGMASTARTIIVGAPGSKGSAVYTSTYGDGNPLLEYGFDSLAWGRDCGDPTASVLVFSSFDPLGIFAIRFDGNGRSAPFPLLVFDTSQGVWFTPDAYAFSPSGQHLAYGGMGSDGSYGLWLLPMCADYPAVPTKLRSYGLVNGWPPIISSDWSRWGDRLALSVIVGPNPGFKWRDIEIIDLNYTSPADNNGIENVSFAGSRILDLDDLFTAESSEHTPQWGPSAIGAVCQRIAFSQSSDIAPRALYLLDVNDGSGNLCEINVPLKLAAQFPRALDWK